MNKNLGYFAHVQTPGLFSGRRDLGMRLTNIQTYIHTYIHTYIVHTLYIHTYIHNYYHNVVDKISCLLGSFTWQEIRKNYIHDDLHKYMSVLPLDGIESILRTLPLSVWPRLARTQMMYFVLHWRLGKVPLVVAAVGVLVTVYIIQEPFSGW